jgi:cytosine/adenosine deaminase-related metal-dependent hydrolase
MEEQMTHQGGRLLIKGGAVLSMDPAIGDLRRGDVLIADGAIEQVAERIDAEDCELLDATDMIVMPGLVDAHRHLWYAAIRGTGMDATLTQMAQVNWPLLGAHYTPQDLYAANRAGAVDALAHGVTTVFDWCHVMNSPDHGPEAVRALQELPIRAVFGYGASMTRKLTELAGAAAYDDSWDPARAVRSTLGDGGRVTMALGVQGPDYSDIDVTRADVGVARELDIPICMHIGVPAGAVAKRGIAALEGAGLLGSDMQFAHCCGSEDDELAMAAAAGAVVAACPVVELLMGMGQPPLGRLRDAGLPIAVGADSVVSASGDLFEEARVGLIAERSLQTRRLNASGVSPDRPEQLGMTSREALESITIGAARASFLGDRVGSLTPGKRADVILLRASDSNLAARSGVLETVVGHAHGANVDTVIVDGRVVRRGGAFVDLDEASVRRELEAARDRVYAAGGYDPDRG